MCEVKEIFQGESGFPSSKSQKEYHMTYLTMQLSTFNLHAYNKPLHSVHSENYLVHSHNQYIKVNQELLMNILLVKKVTDSVK